MTSSLEQLGNALLPNLSKTAFQSPLMSYLHDLLEIRRVLCTDPSVALLDHYVKTLDTMADTLKSIVQQHVSQREKANEMHRALVLVCSVMLFQTSNRIAQIRRHQLNLLNVQNAIQEKTKHLTRQLANIRLSDAEAIHESEDTEKEEEASNFSDASEPSSPEFASRPKQTKSLKPIKDSVCNRRPNHPPKVSEKLRKWLHEHEEHPYPTEAEKRYLSDKTGLNMTQINNWFINARRRYLKK